MKLLFHEDGSLKMGLDISSKEELLENVTLEIKEDSLSPTTSVEDISPSDSDHPTNLTHSSDEGIGSLDTITSPSSIEDGLNGSVFSDLLESDDFPARCSLNIDEKTFDDDTSQEHSDNDKFLITDLTDQDISDIGDSEMGSDVSMLKSEKSKDSALTVSDELKGASNVNNDASVVPASPTCEETSQSDSFICDSEPSLDVNDISKKKSVELKDGSTSSNLEGKNVSDARQESQVSDAGQESEVSNAGQESQVSKAGQESEVSDAGQESQVSNAGQESQVSNSGQENQVSKAGQESQVSDAGQESQVSDAGQESQVSNDGQESQLSDAGQESQVSNAGQESQVSNDGQESQLSDAGQESQLSNAGQESQVSNVQEESQVSNVEEESHSSNVEKSPVQNIEEVQASEVEGKQVSDTKGSLLSNVEESELSNLEGSHMSSSETVENKDSKVEESQFSDTKGGQESNVEGAGLVDKGSDSEVTHSNGEEVKKGREGSEISSLNMAEDCVAGEQNVGLVINDQNLSVEVKKEETDSPNDIVNGLNVPSDQEVVSPAVNSSLHLNIPPTTTVTEESVPTLASPLPHQSPQSGLGVLSQQELSPTSPGLPTTEDKLFGLSTATATQHVLEGQVVTSCLKSVSKSESSTKKKIEDEVALMKAQLHESQTMVKRLQSHILQQQVQNRHIVSILKMTIQQKDDALRKQRITSNTQLGEALSHLLYLEGNIKKEHENVKCALQEKDTVINKQQEHIGNLSAANEHLLSALKGINGLKGPNGVAYDPAESDSVEDEDEPASPRSPSFLKSSHKSIFSFGSVKDKIKRHHSTLDLSDGPDIDIKQGLIRRRQYCSQENLMSIGRKKEVREGRDKKCRSTGWYHDRSNMDLILHEMPDEGDGRADGSNQTRAFERVSSVRTGERSKSKNLQINIENNMNTAIGMSTAISMPTLSHTDQMANIEKERPRSISSMTSIEKMFVAEGSSKKEDEHVRSKSPTPSTTSRGESSNPFKNLKTILKRKGSKSKSKNKRSVTMAESPGNEYQEAMKKHFEKYDMS